MATPLIKLEIQLLATEGSAIADQLERVIPGLGAAIKKAVQDGDTHHEVFYRSSEADKVFQAETNKG